MKKLILTFLACLLLAGTAFAADKTATITWNQPCIDGCPADIPPTGPAGGWRIYMSDVSGTYGTTPIIDLPYNGTPAPSYSSTYVLSLTGVGIKYFVVTAYGRDDPTLESGYSNEVNYPYNLAGPAIPVTVTFTIQ